MKTAIAPALLFCLLLSPPGVRAEDAKKTTPAAVKTIKDVAYDQGKDADAERHKLDLYLPANKGFPVLVYIHGGGWSKGDRKSFEKQGQMLAAHGIGVASVGYRLSPQVKHPVHAQDVAKAFAYVYKNIGKYGGKTDQLFIAGHSAGGHLAALIATDEKYLKAEGLSLKDIKGAIPISGVYTIRANPKSTTFPTDEEGSRQASPQTHVKAGLPPFLVLYAEKDGKDFDKMAENFCKAIRAEKGEATCLKINDRTHGSIMTSMASADDPAAQAVLQFIARHSGRKLPTRSTP